MPLVFVVNKKVAYQTFSDPTFLAKLKENASKSKIVIGGGGANRMIQIPQRSRGRPPTSSLNKIQL